MLNKNELKDIQSLGLKKHREERGLFIAEGPKVVRELLQLIPDRLVKLYALPSFFEEEALSLRSLPHEEISERELERISQLQTPNTTLAVFRQFEPVVPVAKGFILYLDGIQDPGNMGTIIRIADWFGIEQVVAGAGSADLYNPKVVQSTMASIARVKFYEDGDGSWIRNVDLPRYAAVLGGNDVYQEPKTSEGVLMIGNESKGLSKTLVDLSRHKITIPRIGEAESLNAAVATGIILSHLLPS